MILIRGANGQGKSNLLEAIYMLAVAKSARASSDRELVRWGPVPDQTHCQVSAVAQRDGEQLRVQIDLSATPVDPERDGRALDNEESSVANGDFWARQNSLGTPVQKRIRVNGAPRRSSELIGQINAVQFSARDLELIYGTPTLRRRYLDILISQLDNRYLRALQRYQRVIYQRNHLLRGVREGRSEMGELEFWDEELVEQARYIMAQRIETVRRLSELTAPIHGELTSQRESLQLVYRPSVELGEDTSEEAIARELRATMNEQRRREVAQGATVVGPHRDDVEIIVDGKNAGTYASRGQSRTIILAMKLAEARYLRTRRQIEPILLLDDVLSELDSTRRDHVLDTASQCEQCFITATDVEPIEQRVLSQMTRFVVQQGNVKPDTVPVQEEAERR